MRLTQLLRRVWPKSKEQWEGELLARDKLNLAHDAAMLQDARGVLTRNRQAYGAGLYTQIGQAMSQDPEPGAIHIGDVNQAERGTVAKMIAAAVAGGSLVAGGIVLSKLFYKPAEKPPVVKPVVIDNTKDVTVKDEVRYEP